MTSSTPSDQELVARTLAGDEACFHELIERHGAPVWSGLQRLLPNREDAREAFQETFLRAYQRLGSLREVPRLRSWLLSIAFNFARQRLRSPAHGVVSIRHEEGSRTARGLGAEERLSPPASEAVERAELEQRLAAEVAGLPPRQREVVELRIHAELSHAEIAELLGISEDSSRANFYQGVRNLRARLGPTWLESQELA